MLEASYITFQLLKQLGDGRRNMHMQWVLRPIFSSIAFPWPSAPLQNLMVFKRLY